jgi:hypothetical protein
MTRQSFRTRWTNAMAGLTLATAATLIFAAGARAQTTPADLRWQAWVGCWTPADGPSGSKVCIIPTQGTSAVDVATVAGGKIISREHMQADAGRRRSGRSTANASTYRVSTPAPAIFSGRRAR